MPGQRDRPRPTVPSGESGPPREVGELRQRGGAYHDERSQGAGECAPACHGGQVHGTWPDTAPEPGGRAGKTKLDTSAHIYC